jgi:hypothetical protein
VERSKRFPPCAVSTLSSITRDMRALLVLRVTGETEVVLVSRFRRV